MFIENVFNVQEIAFEDPQITRGLLFRLPWSKMLQVRYEREQPADRLVTNAQLMQNPILVRLTWILYSI